MMMMRKLVWKLKTARIISNLLYGNKILLVIYIQEIKILTHSSLYFENYKACEAAILQGDSFYAVDVAMDGFFFFII